MAEIFFLRKKKKKKISFLQTETSRVCRVVEGEEGEGMATVGK